MCRAVEVWPRLLLPAGGVGLAFGLSGSEFQLCVGR